MPVLLQTGIALLDVCFRMALELRKMSCQAQENKNLCAQLAQDAGQIAGFLSTMQTTCGELPSSWNQLLKALYESLQAAEEFVKNYGQTRGAAKFFFAAKVRQDYNSVKGRLQDCINNLNLIVVEQTQEIKHIIHRESAQRRTDSEHMERRIGEKMEEVVATMMEKMVHVMERMLIGQNHNHAEPSARAKAAAAAANDADQARKAELQRKLPPCSSSNNNAARASVHKSMTSMSTLGSQVHGKMFDEMVVSSVRESVAFMQSSMKEFNALTPVLQQELQKQAQQTDDEAQKAALQCMMAELSKVPADAVSAPPKDFAAFFQESPVVSPVASPAASPHSSALPANDASQQGGPSRYPSLTPVPTVDIAQHAANAAIPPAGRTVSETALQYIGKDQQATSVVPPDRTASASNLPVAPPQPRPIDISIARQSWLVSDVTDASVPARVPAASQLLRAAAEEQMTWEDWRQHRNDFFGGHDVSARIDVLSGSDESVAAAMSAATLGCTVSLCGRVQCGEDIVIQTPYLRIEGGDLDILAGHKLIIEAQGVELQDVRITGQVRVQGSGTTVAMRNVTISNPHANGIAMVVKDAATSFVFNSSIEGNDAKTQKLSVVLVSGGGSKVFFEGSTVQNACGAVMHVKDGASCLLRRCRVLKSHELHGMCVEGSRSTLLALETEVCNHHQICVFVRDAATVMMSRCRVGQARGEAAVCALGSDSRPGSEARESKKPFVHLHECEVFGNASCDVVAGKGAYVALSVCHLRSSGQACLKISAQSKLAIDEATVVEDASLQTIGRPQLFNLPQDAFDGLHSM